MRYLRASATFVCLLMMILPPLPVVQCFAITNPDLIHQALVAFDAATKMTASTGIAAAADDFLFAALNVMENTPRQRPPPPPPPVNAEDNNKENDGKSKNAPLSSFNAFLRPWIIRLDLPAKQEIIDDGISLTTPPRDYTTTTSTAMLDLQGNPVRPLVRTIRLTPQEQALFRLVMAVRNQHAPTTTIRVAGGWTRDKLLQRDTTTAAAATGARAAPDIDFCLSDMSGSQFARLLYEYLIEHANDDKNDSPLGQTIITLEEGGVSTTNNTALKDYKDTQSQHLQTASLRIGEFVLDFCQLRFEKYNADSRVPAQTGMAQAIEDAFRRDLTINALFYNLNTNRVEDWTERGLEDLYLRNLATPTPPRKALMQDPLRVLRAIRFAAQLSYNVDPDLLAVAKQERIHLALLQKVSAVRMGNEIDGIFQSADPTRGIGLLRETKLMDTVFSLDHEAQLAKPPDFLYTQGYNLIFDTQSLASRVFRDEAAAWDTERRRFLWYAAFFKPICEASTIPRRQQKQLGKKQRREGSILYQLLVKQLGRPIRDLDSIESVLEGAKIVQILLRKYNNLRVLKERLTDNAVSDVRWACYRILKRVGPFWKECLLLALAASSNSNQSPEESVRLYKDIITIVEEQLALDASVLFDKASSKPLLNGGEIQKRALPGLHGKDFRKILKAQEEWQIRHCWGTEEDNNDLQNATKEAQTAALIDYLVQTFPEYC